MGFHVGNLFGVILVNFLVPLKLGGVEMSGDDDILLYEVMRKWFNIRVGPGTAFITDAGDA
jgi:hypothetical protein